MSIANSLRINMSYRSEVDQPAGIGQAIDNFGPDTLNLFFGAGVAASQVDRAYQDDRTLPGTSFTYVLSALPSGVAMARVRLLYLRVITAVGAGGSLAVAPGGTHPWPGEGGWSATPGGVLIKAWPDGAGAPAAPGASDQLTVTATGSIHYVLALLGCST